MQWYHGVCSTGYGKFNRTKLGNVKYFLAFLFSIHVQIDIF